MSGMDDHELSRFIDDPDGSALGRSLVASARADVPSPDGRARTAKRLGIAAVLAVGAGAGSEAGALAAAWKLAAVVVALGGVVGLAIWQAPASEPARAAPPRIAVQAAPPARSNQRASDAPVAPPPIGMPPPIGTPPIASAPGEPQPAALMAAPQPPASPRAPSRAIAPSLYSHGARAPSPVVSPPTSGGQAVAAPAPAQESPPAPEVRAPEPSAPEPAVPEPVVTPAPAAATPPPPEIAAGPGRLAAEVALVDRARTSLGAGDYPAAKAALAEYHQRFASGDLDAEAEVVTIELLIAERDVLRARTLGTTFLAHFPRSPLAQRVHSLLDRLPK